MKITDEDYWAQIPPIVPDGIEAGYDAGADGCMPAGWYIIGTNGGFPVTHQEFGPYENRQEALDDISAEFKSLPVIQASWCEKEGE